MEETDLATTRLDLKREWERSSPDAGHRVRPNTETTPHEGKQWGVAGRWIHPMAGRIRAQAPATKSVNGERSLQPAGDAPSSTPQDATGSTRGGT